MLVKSTTLFSAQVLLYLIKHQDPETHAEPEYKSYLLA